MVHSELANVSQAQIKAQLATMFKAKEEAISVVGLHTKFGGGRSSGMALIYDNLDAKKRYDSKMRLHNVSTFSFHLRGELEEITSSAFSLKSSQLVGYAVIITLFSIY